MSRAKSQPYEVEEVDFRYNKLIFDSEEDAESVLEGYNDSRSNISYLRHAIGGSFFATNDFTPLRISDRPNEIFVTKRKTNDLERTADEVLEK